MFNNLKSKEFFDPNTCKKAIHIIGSGAVGGSVAELLTRLGVNTINIWDADTVSPHNLGNQVFRTKDIGRPKTEAISEILKEINPDINICQKGFVSVNDRLSGYIFLCIDNIDVRRQLCEKWKYRPDILYITDGRMRLTDGTIHSADWCSPIEKENLIASMQFTHEEALANTPVSACGLSLSVVCTPRTLASLMVANWIKFLNTKKYNRFIQVDSYEPFLDAYLAN